PNHPKDYGRLQGPLAFQHFGCGIDGIIERVQCFPRSLRPRFSNSGCTASRRAAEVRAPACPLCSLPCTRTVGNLRREGNPAPRPLAEIRRSEERRVGKEGRSRWWRYQYKKK